MLSVGQLAKQFGLSRSTLLYYDKIGLLHASGRSPANYRLYNAQDVQRMQQIDLYRRSGLSLENIRRVIDNDGGPVPEILGQRLTQINTEISALRAQQRALVRLIEDESLRPAVRTMSKEQWVGILRASGMSDGDMMRWHQEFEDALPEVHQDFLESLGLEPAEINRIRLGHNT